MLQKIRFDIYSYFTEIYTSYLSHSFFGKLSRSNNIEFNLYSFFYYAKLLNYKKIDSKPFGHSKGLLLRYDFIYDLLFKIYGNNLPFIIHPSPSGILLDTNLVKKISNNNHIVFINSRYEGIDTRAIHNFNITEISIGDYILYDGDTATMVIMNTLIRYNFVKPIALIKESLDNNLLEYEQYTRPVNYNNYSVPNILRSGNHQKIENWKLSSSIKKTKNNRPDIYVKYNKEFYSEYSKK